jgi:hypothetical protein
LVRKGLTVDDGGTVEARGGTPVTGSLHRFNQPRYRLHEEAADLSRLQLQIEVVRVQLAA